MRYAVIGGDMRFAHLARMLEKAGRPATGFLLEKAGMDSVPLSEIGKCSTVICNWPLRWPLADADVKEKDILDQLAPGTTLLLCGPKYPAEKRWDLQYVNLWADERLLQENAWLTAEGAVASAVSRTGFPIMGRSCAIVGYGRIGRALTEILMKLGGEVTVFSRTESKRRLAQESGAKSKDLGEIADCIHAYDIVFSTPPSTVMDRKVLEKVGQDTLILDLASPPYGVDMDAARELGLRALREPGLPGRYCPLSAARAIYNAVLRWEEENHG